MGTLKTTNIESISGSGTVTLGTSGETFALGAGVVQSNMLYPAFEAYLSANQTLSDDTITKLQINTEIYDTDSKYDNSTNYRFTPASSGKYFVYGATKATVDTASQLRDVILYIYKNGSAYKRAEFRFANNDAQRTNPYIGAGIDFNTTDYVELFLYINNAASGVVQANADDKATYFGAYRIGT
jgi:hypothetical protein